MGNRRSFIALAGTLGLCGLLWTAARSQNSLPPVLGAVLTGRDAYVVQPPEMIAGGNVTDHTVSSTGGYVLVVRRTPPRLPTSVNEKSSPNAAEVSLHFWDTAERRGGVLWREMSSERLPVGMNLFGFLPNTNLALATVGRGIDTKSEGTQFLLINVAKRTVREIAAGALDDIFIVSRAQPRAAIFSEKNKTMRIISAEGAISSPYPLSIPGWDSGFISWMWHKDGQHLMGSYVVREPNEKPRRLAVLLDADTGKITPYTGKPEYEQEESAPPPPIQIWLDKGEVKQADTAVPLTPLWLVGTEKDAEGRALITPNGSRPELLSRAILFYSDGALYSAPLQRMERETFVALRRQQWKMQAMNNAKQIGLAMMMYAQDYDENFPSPDSNLKDIVDPYLKNDSVWNNPETSKFGFQPAYKQTALSGYSTPATTPLGYLMGPGGRAVIFVDGHVRWEDDKP